MKILKYALPIFFLVAVIFGCEKETPTAPEAPTPEITSIEPDTAYGGEPVIITGRNFNPDPEKNIIIFGGGCTRPDEATNTTLNAIAPIVGGTKTVTVKVWVTRVDCTHLSNALDFTFPQIMRVIDETIAHPMGVAVDEDDNVYVGSQADGAIYKFTPDGVKTKFADAPVSGAIEFGPNNYLYVCEQGEGKIVRISPDGSSVEDVVVGGSPIDFDWDAAGNMYIVSNWEGIYKYDIAGNLAQEASIGNPKSCRIFENYLYVTDIWASTVWRFEITEDGLQNGEVILTPENPLGIEIDVEGTLYYSKAWEPSIYTLAQDGSEGILFDGQLMTPIRYMTYYGKTMYMVYPGWTGVGKVMSAYIGVEQAPNYGRQ